MFKAAASCLFLILLALPAQAEQKQSGSLANETITLSATCKHYINRAKFKHRHPDQEFVVTLADACTAASASLRAESPREVNAATDFLVRLRTLRDLIIDMNMRRVFGDNYTAWTRMNHGAGSMIEPVPRVSALGEYLIARELGLMTAYQTWLDTGPILSLAKPDPLQPRSLPLK